LHNFWAAKGGYLNSFHAISLVEIMSTTSFQILAKRTLALLDHSDDLGIDLTCSHL